MRHLIPCLALLVAAVLLYGAAADNKCDPSSTNCSGAVKEQGARPSAFAKPKVTASTQSAPAANAKPKAATKAAKKAGPRAVKSKPGPIALSSKVAQDDDNDQYYDSDGDELQQYDPAKWQQEGGLEDAPISAILQFSASFNEGLPNYFDADEGYVPLNFGNSEGEPSCEIVADAVEFAYEGHSNRFTVDVDPTGLITLTDHVKKDGKNNPMVIVLMSPAFRGYTISQPLSSTFPTSLLSADLLDGTITITVPELNDLETGQKLEAMWKLSVCDATASANVCCVNGQYRRPSKICREREGPCDEEEWCTGYNPTCPEDVFLPSGKVCKHPETFCEEPSECTGQGKDCPPLYKEDNTACPWAKDCDGCTFNTTGTDLKYSRTSDNPYSKGYKLGEYGKPDTHWPVCIGRCSAGSCLIQPKAATCCREDEEAYPLEEADGYEYDGGKKEYEEVKKGYGPGKYHPAELEAGPRHARDARVGIAETIEVRQTSTQARREARRKRTAKRRAAARNPKLDEETIEFTADDEPTAHGKHSSKTTDPTKTAKSGSKKESEQDFFGGKHKEKDAHPHRDDEPDVDGPDDPRRGDGYGRAGYGKDSYDKSDYKKDGYGKGKYDKEYDEGKEYEYAGPEYSIEEEDMPLSCWSA